MQNLVVVSQAECAYVGSTKNLGDPGATPPWDKSGAWLTPDKHAPPLLPHQIWSL